MSAIVSVPVLAPVAVGLKVTLIAQFAPAATEVPQVLVWAKSPLFDPVMVMLVMFSVPLPVFESVTFCAVLVEPRG